jgi:hypothetical protein
VNVVDLLRDQFNAHVALREKRPGVMQLIAPLFHEDGDMMDIFLGLPASGNGTPPQRIRISDHGLTLMRLSYTFDIDTANRERIFRRILAENGIQEESGELFMNASPDSLYVCILQFSQGVQKVCNMRYFRREVLASLFEEMLAEFIERELQRFHPRQKVYPIPDRDDLEVDWEFRPNGTPLYLFALKGVDRARLATISCQQFQLRQLPFKSIAVHEDIDRLGRKDRNRLTNACDKQFTSLDEFKQNAISYLARETV